MKRVCVIGSNSFAGSDFIDLLLEEKRFDILGVSRSPEKSALFLSYKRHETDHFRFEQIDLNENLDRLITLLDDFQPDYIVNFAAQSEVAPSWDNPDHWYQTNVVALTRLVNYLKDKKYLKKYVHISSPEVYGTCDGVITEEAPLNPSTPYAASKAAGDLSLFTYVKNFNFPLVVIRATNYYGPRQQLFKIIPRSMLYIRQNKKIHLHGGGIAVKSYIHIRDVSKGELLAMEKGKPGEIYHLSPDSGVSVRSVVTRICDHLRADFNKATVVVEERLGQDKAYVIDSTKAREKLGWKPEIALDEGIKQTADWVTENFEALQNESLEYNHKK
jgi:dTDP-glucose 4,6-dehydratase